MLKKTDTSADGPDFIGAGMITMDRNFDLFYFDQSFPGDPEDDSDNGEWRNFKYYVANDLPFKAPTYYLDDTPMNTNAYLYANEQETTLSFTGPLYSDIYYRYKVLPINDDADEEAQGVHLLGNPYTCNAYINTDDYYYNDDFVSGCFYLNEWRNDVEIYYGEDYSYTLLAPMTAFFVKVTEDFVDDPGDDNHIELKPHAPYEHQGENFWELRSTSKSSTMSIELTSNGARHDRVIVNAGEGKECTKFSMSSRTPKIFVPQGNKKYAMVSTKGANVMPLCFTTKTNGIYTLNFNTKNMNCSYLHLIDNATGADIDLLRTPSYSFNSGDAHYAARFKIVFAEEATNDIADSFAFISNGELIINGTGTVQIFDIVGRNLFTQELQTLNSQL